MANFVNDISLAPDYVNTGEIQDFLEPGFTHRIILIPKGKKFTQAEMQTPYATLLALISNNTNSLRAYPIGNFIGLDDKSTEATIVTSATGRSTWVKDGQYHHVYEYDKGGANYDNFLANFQNAQDYFDLLILDKDNNAMIGTRPVLNTSNYVLQGFSLDLIYNPLMKWNNGADPTRHYIGFAFSDTDEFKKRLVYKVIPDSQPVLSLVGLKNLEFAYQPPYQALTSSVAKLRVTTGGGATDLYDLYGAALVALTANWSFRDASNNSLTCTVSLDAATKTLVFTFSGAGYTGLASGAVIQCYTPTISQMAATIPGFANGYFELTK